MELLNTAYSEGILNKNEKSFLSVSSPPLALFYHLPKIHKNLEHPPGRPIISGIGCLTSQLSHFLDLYLQEIVITLPSYLKDSASLIRDLKEIQWQPGYIFLTLDVTSLYSNIQHELGLKTTSSYLHQIGKMQNEQIQFLLNALRFILTHNVFTHEGSIYHQQHGTAIRTRNLAYLCLFTPFKRVLAPPLTPGSPHSFPSTSTLNNNEVRVHSPGSKDDEEPTGTFGTENPEEISETLAPEPQNVLQAEEAHPNLHNVPYDSLPALVQAYMAKNEENQQKYMAVVEKFTDVVENACSKVGQEMSHVTQAILMLNYTIAKNFQANDKMQRSQEVNPPTSTGESPPISPDIVVPTQNIMTSLQNLAQSPSKEPLCLPVLATASSECSNIESMSSNVPQPGKSKQSQFLLNIKQEMASSKQSPEVGSLPNVSPKQLRTHCKVQNNVGEQPQTLKRTQKFLKNFAKKAKINCSFL
ncbi:uncharacterized protein LOC130367455 [Hyla sarda]|uniref:uncharacterized protein LOC130367455 n=1 Tax=Hyla sarda TaxID=327740 RepID=UPI0024C22314|nr:uncharacterized protein LOC130367455 [Hyla sarda]